MYLKSAELGLSFPDPNLKKTLLLGVWQFSDPDWDEFKRVINGDGPCNAERLAVRNHAEAAGKWVRRSNGKKIRFIRCSLSVVISLLL
jgi:ring-1,2-phenylacetyl-CoA epoxidase subunit PaaA